ncbi:Clathrin interactor EPSIN 1, partial [Linum perenne]
FAPFPSPDRDLNCNVVHRHQLGAFTFLLSFFPDLPFSTSEIELFSSTIFSRSAPMDFMKVIDQTVREIKREVNLKVLKVPEIEQKALDATNDEPWGPHGTVLQEISQATRKYTECQMIMSVLWTRLGETGKDWRLVYKALSVIEYLVAHGSERAVDDIIEHTYQISSLTSFDYVEPSGKDMGINVRKKAETIVNLLNSQEKIQEVRSKASANRDKYFGLSSTGITSKSSASAFGSSSYKSSDRYGGFSSAKDTDGFRDGYKSKDRYEEKIDKDAYVKPRRAGDIQGSTGDKGSTDVNSKGQSKFTVKFNDTGKESSVPAQQAGLPSINIDDDLDDDFDPRGNAGNKSTAETSSQVDLFGQSLMGDLLDVQPSAVPAEISINDDNSSKDVDLFADADFVSAEPQVDKGASSQEQVDLFASQSAAAAPSAIDFFSAGQPTLQESKPPKLDATSTSVVDPFAAVPMYSFDGSDPFGEFSSSSSSATTEPVKNTVNGAGAVNMDENIVKDTKPPTMQKKNFQVKSGIWADSLSRGIIDLNISARKYVLPCTPLLMIHPCEHINELLSSFVSWSLYVCLGVSLCMLELWPCRIGIEYYNEHDV